MESMEQNNRDGLAQRSMRLHRVMVYIPARILVVLKNVGFDGLEFKRNATSDRVLLDGKENSLINRLSQELQARWDACGPSAFKSSLSNQTKTGLTRFSKPHFRRLCMRTVNMHHEIEEQLNEVNQTILSAFTSYQKEGSGWMLSEILLLGLNVAQSQPLKGSNYLPLPKKLKDKKAITNIKNDDNKCFMWSVNILFLTDLTQSSEFIISNFTTTN